jgi:hypothetical protein
MKVFAKSFIAEPQRWNLRTRYRVRDTLYGRETKRLGLMMNRQSDLAMFGYAARTIHTAPFRRVPRAGRRITKGVKEANPGAPKSLRSDSSEFLPTCVRLVSQTGLLEVSETRSSESEKSRHVLSK